MEISKGLQEDIIAVQNKLKNAIRDHQICVGKLKDDPDNPDILGQIQQIQLHIVSLGRYQKQIVQRLRKEVEAFKAENTNGAKVSIASLLGLNNNNHITNNNEAKRNEIESNGLAAKMSKDDYEEDVVRNGDVPSLTRDLVHNKGRPSSVETISGEDDVIEVSVDENSCEKQEEMEDWKAESEEKLTFLTGLGLITTLRCSELQNKRAERKRRSTANPQFVYTSLEMPTKRKRYSYLQSSGNAPQTRQSTARMNGPSPPPAKVLPPKATSPPTKVTTKALISLQKSTTRPNILRNVGESKVLVGKAKLENGRSQTQLSNMKAVQPVSSKTVHIPGLPSSLTIERIENDSVVCINCRNPGTLTVCENCSANYHVSCHSISPAPSRICPKCALKETDGTLSGKREEELEEKERERYELRERNSDLRLQVYELEKRSQLLGQSLQLQQRTRQELLGKQEKTQRSIKRLVDFIKVMQLRRNESLLLPSASGNYQPQRSSSQSPRTPSPPQVSNNQDVPTNRPLPPAICVQRPTCPTILFFSGSCHNQMSPTPSQSPRCHTPTSSIVSYMANQKSTINHTSSSKSSQSLLENTNRSDSSMKPEVKPRAWDFPQCSAVNSQPQSVHTTLASSVAFPTSATVVAIPLPCTSTDEPPEQAVAVVRKSQNERSPRSIAFSTTRVSPSRQPIVSWNSQPSTDGSLKLNSHTNGRCLGLNPDLSTLRTSSCRLTTSLAIQQTTESRSRSSPSSKSCQQASVDTAGIGQRAQVYSTHCSQAITSPIPSPIVFTNHRETAQTETPSLQAVSVSNGIPSPPAGWKQASSQTSPRTTFSEVPSASSSNT